MRAKPHKNKLLAVIFAALTLGALSAKAGSASFDLNTQPGAEFVLVGSAEWVADGGVNNSGHIKLIDNTGQSCAVLFPDFEPGFVVASFTFECMIKCGDWYNNPPADGFSVNFARGDDPIIGVIEGGENPGRGGRTDGWAGSQDNNGNENNLPEEGTQTGIAIGFDTWGTGAAPVGGSNGPQDVRGISVRVDGKQFAQVAMPNVLFPEGYDYAADATTLITGPFTCGPDPNNANVGNGDCDGDGSPEHPPATGAKLLWAPLKVEVKADGKVNVWWKNQQIVTELQTPYGPGPGRIVFGASTGGAMQYTGIDDIKITTVPSECITPGGVTARVDGFSITVADSGASVLDPASVKVKLDGADVAVTASKTGGVTTLRYDLPAGAAFDSGSSHTVSLEAKDTRGICPISVTRTFNAPAYATVPPEFAVTGVDKTKPGFIVKIHQQARRVTNNNNEQTEQMLAGDYGPNVADLSLAQPDGSFIDEDVINYDQSAGNAGNFTPDEQMPGIPGTTDSTDYIAMQALCFIEFPTAGFYTLGVNSDDGFRVRIGRNLLDRWRVGAIMLGEFNGGRGASDTLFTFRVLQAGVYPLELTWEEGEGGASVEFFSVLADGTKVLVNDTATDGHLKVYRAGPFTDIPYIASLKPGRSQGGFNVHATAATAHKVEVVIKDGVTTASNIKMKFDGASVTPTVNKVGDTTTVTYTDPMKLLGTHTVELSYDYGSPAQTRTVSWSYYNWKAEPGDLPSNSFNIEAEDFNYDGGQTKAEASTMPYLGGAYAGLGAIEGIDFNNDDGNDSDQYRTELPASGANENEVNMDPATSQRFATLRPGGYEVTTNHKIGWVGGGQWENYTRTIPAGIYTAYFAKSFDGWGGGQLAGTLELVTSDPTRPNQTTTVLGSYSAPGSGGWGHNDLVPLETPLREAAYFKLPGGAVTLRTTHGSGDFDFFTLVPSPSAPPTVVSASPASGAIVNLNQRIQFVVQEFGTTLVQSSVRLEIDGTDVTSAASITKDGDLTTISYTPTALFAPGSAHVARLSFSDNGTPPTSKNYSIPFTIYPVGAAGMFQIEAEDFNFDGGQTKAEASTFPYLGGAYAGLGAIEGIDFNNDDDNSSDQYRTERPDTGANENEVNINENLGGRLGRQRGLWDVTVNWKIGWVGGPNEWYNYTRTLPSGDYKVYAALSFDGTAASQLKGRLERVTSDPKVANQTVEVLGYFDAPGTAALGGWGANDLVPMRDTETGGNEKVISLGGTQTLRFNSQSGDFDYLVFVPTGVAPPPPRFTSITRNAQTGAITVTWEGGGTLEAAPTVLGPWQPVPGATSPFTFTPNPAQPVLFGKIRR